MLCNTRVAYQVHTTVCRIVLLAFNVFLNTQVAHRSPQALAAYPHKSSTSLQENILSSLQKPSRKPNHTKPHHDNNFRASTLHNRQHELKRLLPHLLQPLLALLLWNPQGDHAKLQRLLQDVL